MHFAIVTNIDLCKWKILPSDLCTFCNIEKESIAHLFIYCPATRTIWNNLNDWLQNVIHREIVIREIEILLCNHDILVINHLIVMTLQYIYQCRCLKKIPSFGQLKNNITESYYIEKSIADSNKPLMKHHSKWQILCIE